MTEIALQTRLHTEINSDPADGAWDAFLSATPGGSHLQSSLWAQVKAGLGWRPVRIKVHDGQQLLAGAQLLLKPLPIAGRMGYIPKGPVIRQPDAAVREQLLTAIHRVARDHWVQYLVIQPPAPDTSTGAFLTRHGFRESALDVGPTATVRIDLTQNLDTILARMKPKTRYNIRLGERRGITVRQGTQQDIPLFYKALVATSHRQGFMPYSQSYFETMARVFEPQGALQLFIALYRDEPVSILLAICFGDTVVYKKGAWFGRHGEHHPNEVLHWAAMQWAKSHGYHHYDLEGIEWRAAKALLRGEPLPEVMHGTVTHFKVGFGGEIAVLPQPYDYVYNPMLRWTYQTLGHKLLYSTAFSKLRDLAHKR